MCDLFKGNQTFQGLIFPFSQRCPEHFFLLLCWLKCFYQKQRRDCDWDCGIREICSAHPQVLPGAAGVGKCCCRGGCVASLSLLAKSIAWRISRKLSFSGGSRDFCFRVCHDFGPQPSFHRFTFMNSNLSDSFFEVLANFLRNVFRQSNIIPRLRTLNKSMFQKQSLL